MASDSTTNLEATCSTETEKYISELCKDGHSQSGDEGLFYFETDYLPLKGNIDYLKLMKTLAVLEVQRSKVLKDINDLRGLKTEALDKPLVVKNKILEGKLECLHRVKIEKVPDIDFSKYRSLAGSSKKGDSSNSHQKSNKTPKQQTSQVEDGNSSTGSDIVRVRGRVYNENKPQTFNQLWTVEEQLRLEQLLSEIPPEPVEYRRWEKIAEALGSRTAQQVCSRVQKYFKKLAKAGINAPSTSRKKKTSYRRRAHFVHKQHKHFLYKPSTFFPGAGMGQLEESDSGQDSSEDSSSRRGAFQSPDTTADLSHWDEIYKKIQEDQANEELKVEHIGFKCSKCGVTPIRGLRWECTSCPGAIYCSVCLYRLPTLRPPPHPLHHRFTPTDLFNNLSYTTESFSSVNYLDPNSHLT